MERTFDLNVAAMTPLITPRALKAKLPMTEAANRTVVEGRRAIRNILDGADRRLLVIVGPCSIHDRDGALEYAERLAVLAEEVKNEVLVVMRTYFEKPRTTIGWKGLINDPNLDGTYDMKTGLYRAREILLRVNEMGLPTASEVLDPIIPQYIADLESWAAIGARTTESQTHREMASGLSMPVGFKNSTDGNLRVAIDALQSARRPHHFLGINEDGQTCIVATRGNPYCHIILRGGQDRPNYDPVGIIMAEEQLRAIGVEPRIMVDCSHDNSGKRPKLQGHVLRSVLLQRIDGNTSIIGAMLESYLREGRQSPDKNNKDLKYGVSITDGCLGWKDTERLLRFAAEESASGASGGTLRRLF